MLPAHLVQPRYTLQIRRSRGGRYVDFHASRDLDAMAWAMKQHLVIDGPDAVRIVDERGRVVARATRHRATRFDRGELTVDRGQAQLARVG